jgi:hypothetical protein
MKTITELYADMRNGEPLSDANLLRLIKHFAGTVAYTEVLGERFALACNEARSRLETLQSMASYRGLKF